jgi:lysophospholipase L1-like esterase
MSRSKKILLRFLSIVFGIIVAGAIGEVALRLGGYSPINVNPLNSFHEGHPLVGYRGKPNFTGRFRRADFDVTISHDENGFRKQEHQNAKEKSRHKVLVFGDSFTWGWGVGQGKVFTDRMSQLMPDYYIMNFGLNASGTVEQFTLFEAYAKELVQEGDTVVLMFAANDFKDNVSGFLRGEVTNGEVRRVGPSRLLASKAAIDASYVMNYLIFYFEVLKATIQEMRAKKRARKLLSLGEGSPEMVVTKHFLGEFKKALAQKRANFLAVYIFGHAELRKKSDEELKAKAGFRRAFFACAEPLGIRTLDLDPYFLQAKSSGRHERFNFPRDGHWNESGHAVAAEAIAEAILRADNHQPDAPQKMAGTRARQ